MAISEKTKKKADLEVIPHLPPEPPVLTRCFALRDFKYSTDGINSFQAVKGEVFDIPTDLVPGLMAEGYVGEPKEKATK